MDMIWQQLLGILQPVVLALAGWGLNTLRNWISTRNSNEALNALIGRMNDAILDAVKTVFQMLVDGIKKDGGVMTLAQQLEAKAKAIAIAKLNMGPTLLNQIKAAKGYTDAQLDEMLAGQVERVIHDTKSGMKNGSIKLENIPVVAPSPFKDKPAAAADKKPDAAPVVE